MRNLASQYNFAMSPVVCAELLYLQFVVLGIVLTQATMCCSFSVIQGKRSDPVAFGLVVGKKQLFSPVRKGGMESAETCRAQAVSLTARAV
jgi:hypothetical protein